MKSWAWIGAFLMVTTLGFAQTSPAFDGQRKGFLLGLGAGASSYQIESDDRNTAFATDLKIGYGFTDRFLLFYTNKVSWRSDNGLVMHGLTAIGGSFYLSPSAPTFFFGGGVGLASSTWISDESDGCNYGCRDYDNSSDDSDSHTGAGFFLAAGFEFARHWNVELNLILDSIDYGGESKDTSKALMLTLNGLAF